MSDKAFLWATVSRLLNKALAQVALPRPSEEIKEHPLIQAYKEFITHNELELAWDKLFEIAEHKDVYFLKALGNRNDFWLFMTASALLMNLPDKADKADKKSEEIKEGEPLCQCSTHRNKV